MKQKTQKVGFKKYLAQQKGRILFYLFLTFIFYLLDVVAVIIVAQFLSFLSTSMYDTALKILVIITTISLINRFAYWISCVLYFKISGRLALNMKTDLADRSLMLSSKTFSDSSAGLFITRITKDPDDVFKYLDSLVDSFASVITFSVTIVYIMFLNVWIGLIMLFSLLSLSLLEYYKVKLYRRNQLHEKSINDKVTSLTNEIVRSEMDIKSLNLNSTIRHLTYDNYNEFRQAYLKCRLTNTTFWNTRRFLILLFTSAMTFIGLFLLKDTVISLAAFLYIFTNRNALNDMVWHTGNIVQKFADVKIAGTRMFEIFDEKKYPIETFGNVSLKNCEGNISFKDVTFSYEIGSIKDDTSNTNKKNKKQNNNDDNIVAKNSVFKKLNFDIKKNTTVAFVGKSGSGKTTILNLIAKMHTVEDGKVTIDDVNINDLTQHSLRSNISLVNQFPYIFDTTIKENLLMAKNNATNKELWEVCEKAHLIDFIKSLPNQLETRVGENGVKLSGGQRQRLAIARALLRNSKIILFDESTSSLDNLAQEKIKQSIEGLSGEHTIVIVAHRLSTIKTADKIFFIENGEISATGTFEEIYKNNKNFKQMFRVENV